MNLSLARFCQRIVFRVLLLAFVGIAAALGQGSGASAATFQPSWSASLADDDPGAASDITFELSIPAPDFNFSRLIAFIPPEFAVSDGDSITNGAFTGNVTAMASLGLLGNTCNSSLLLEFQMMDASTDPAYSIPPYYGTDDGDGDGLPDNVDFYPSLMSLIAPDIEPVQRLYGQVLVAGRQIPLNFVIFAPGTPIPLLPAFDASLGYPTVTIVGDPFAVPETNFPISDFCTPLSTTVVLNGVSDDNPKLSGNQGGQVLRTNPAVAGVYNSIVFARSQWDADGDGIENNIDPCPLTADPTWNPRVDAGPGDADDDGLPDSCDPTSASFFDGDGDQYPNRGDYCPNIAADWVHWDQDRDAIGDDCDPFPQDETNGGAAQRIQLCVADTLVVGSPGTLDPPLWSCPGGPDLQVPPRIAVYPEEGAGMVGSVHSIRVSLSKAGLGSGPAAGVTVDFLVTGANPTSGSCLTGNFGDCEFNYIGANEGIDTIAVSATVDGIPVEATATNAWVLPPSNDDFSAATPVPGIPFEDELALMGATNETDEPVCGYSNLSVWYAFTPGETAYVTVETVTGSMYMSLAAYTGDSLGDLDLVACEPPLSGQAVTGSRDHGFPPPDGDLVVGYHIGFEARAGETYYIQIATLPVFGPPDTGTVSIDYAPAGDANCSADLTALDALQVLRTVAGLPAADCAANGDINCDGAVNAVDALVILRVVADIAPPPELCVSDQTWQPPTGRALAKL